VPRAALELRRGLSIIERLQGPKVTAKDAVIENSILTPYRRAETASLYVIRAKPGRSDAVLLAAQRKLLQVDRFRVLLRAQTFAQIRATPPPTNRIARWL
jgi:hypothetical protein